MRRSLMHIVKRSKHSQQSKMKSIVLFLAVLGAATAAILPEAKIQTIQTRDLNSDLEDFIALVPIDKVMEVVIVYLSVDPEVQALVAYAQSEGFKNLVLTVDAIPEYIDFLNYLQKGGLDVYKTVNRLHVALGLKPLPVPSRGLPGSETRYTGGVNGLIKDVIAVLPVDQIKALYEEKLQTSPDFVALIDVLNSKEFQVIVNTLKANQEFQKIVAELEGLGVNVSAIISLLKTLIGME